MRLPSWASSRRRILGTEMPVRDRAPHGLTLKPYFALHGRYADALS
jgi:hypothetical protein